MTGMRRWLLPLFIMALDSIGILSAFLVALFLRFDGQIPEGDLLWVIAYLPLFAAMALSVHTVFRLYTRIWRYAGVAEGISLLAAIGLDSVLWIGVSALLHGSLPRSVYVIAAVLLLFFAGGLRFALRVYAYVVTSPIYLERIRRQRRSRVLIWGAGDAGAVLVRELQNRPGKRQLVGMIDDDPAKKGRSFFGVQILGTRQDLQRVIDEQDAEEIFIAMPSVKGRAMRTILDCCKQTGVQVRILPAVYELVEGMAVSQLRPIEVDDLLGRNPVQLDASQVAAFVRGKIVLITGAGGSIGSEICRQTAHMQPEQLLLLGKGENSIYDIYHELKIKYPQLATLPIIADVRDRERIQEVLHRFRPQIVFHAAAHKHVPLMEYQPMEAVRNNILGTKVIAEEAACIGVEKFIMISTDKAVNPTNVMGATKRVAEMFVQSMNAKGSTKFAAVRFGNVLGSRGSVVPLFKRQIAAGGPVTITDPAMKRYFMTIPEASQLVLQAGAMADGGEVFVLDMGEPVKIVDLAREMIVLSGLVPEEDIKIQFTGLRPGEKLFEELLSAEDGAEATTHEKIFTARIRQVDKAVLDEKIQALLQARTDAVILSLLKEIVPTYCPNHSVA
jgi:FlaA1/EpsC-like NDP-sugar epimerase